MSSDSYHEPLELLSEGTRNLHRAIVSLKEELEAVDWYQQRAEACSDPELKAVIEHNRDEEVEHAMMTLEWIRRNQPTFAKNVGAYVNTTGPITAIESADTGDTTPASTSLGIGSLKGKR